MTKRTSPMDEKLFDIDLESLLEPEFFQANKNKEEIEDFNICSEKKKKVKTKDDLVPLNSYLKSEINIDKPEKTKSKMEEDSGNVSDVKSFFTHFGNDFGKSLELKKARLGKFIDDIMSVYHTKTTEMMRHQEKEMNDFKKQSINKFEEHLKKIEDESNKFKIQETRLIKMLEQQIKIMDKFSTIQKEWIGGFKDLHKFYVQNFAELINKHRNEAINIKQVIDKDISSLQDKFLMEIKREEMLNMKKYLSDVYF